MIRDRLPAIRELQHVFAIGEPGDAPVRAFAELVAGAGDPGLRAGSSRRTTSSRSSTRRARPVNRRVRRSRIARRSRTCRTSSWVVWRRRCGVRRRPKPKTRTPTATLLIVPLFHVTGCLATMMLNYFLGAKLVLMPVGKFDPDEAMAIIEREHITSFGGVPTIMWRILESPNLEKYDLSSVQRSELRRRAGRARTGRADRARVPEPAQDPCHRVRAHRDRIGRGPRSRARTTSPTQDPSAEPAPTVETASSTDDGIDAAAGERGEVWLKGPNVMLAATGAGLMPTRPRSAKVGSTPATSATSTPTGYLYLVDRAKDMIIRAGENIYSVEVEHVLYDHPDVIDAAVVGVPHKTLGEEVKAVVQVREGSTATEEDIRTFPGGLATYNCFPKDVQALKQLAGNTGYHFQLLTSVIEVNELQKRRTVGKLQKHLGLARGQGGGPARAGLQAGHRRHARGDHRSCCRRRLQGEGANVRVYDPVAGTQRASSMPGWRSLYDSALEAIDGADAVVLVTEWPEFGELDWTAEVKERMRVPLVVDGRNFLDRERAERGRLHLRGHRALMQALILAGGEGTRLRPLTSTVPKPVVPLVGRPFIAFMLEWLHDHGVDDVILSCGFMADGVAQGARGRLAATGMRLRYAIEEPSRAGTAGALKFAEEVLDERFARAQRRRADRHRPDRRRSPSTRPPARARRWRSSPVDDPAAYGLVRLDDENRVPQFVEKSRAIRSTRTCINAGAYVLERDVVDLDPGGPQRLDRARGLPRARRRRPLRLRRRAATGSTSARPSATCRRTFDILEGNVATAVRRAPRRGLPRGRRARRARRPDRAAGARRARLRDRGGRSRRAALVVLGDDVTWASGSTIERAVVLTAPRSAAVRAARLHRRRRACASARAR